MKKKILILILSLLLIPSIDAADYSSNMTGITVTPSKNTGGGSCNSGSYWIGYTQAEYKFQGLRISFYNEKGEQVGNTFDSWDWGDTFERNYLSSTGFYSDLSDEKITSGKIDTIISAIDTIEKEYEKIKDLQSIASSHESYKIISGEYKKISGYSLLVVKYYKALGAQERNNFLYNKKIAKLKEVVDEGKQIKKIITNLKLKEKLKTATANGFDVYLKKTNYSLNYYSKVDYLKKGITTSTAKNFKLEDLLDGGYYVYYHDTISHKNNKRTSKWCKKDDGSFGTCYEYVGNLLYSSQDASKAELKAYLTTESVMSRYLKMAGADKLVDIKEGNYTMLIEPTVVISA